MSDTGLEEALRICVISCHIMVDLPVHNSKLKDSVKMWFKCVLFNTFTVQGINQYQYHLLCFSPSHINYTV